MKRFIAIAIFLMACACASAQLKIVSKMPGWKDVVSVNSGLLVLQQRDDTYRLKISAVGDIERKYFFALGTGKESAVQTVVDLLALMDEPKGTEITVKNGDEETVFVRLDALGGGRLEIQDEKVGVYQLKANIYQKNLAEVLKKFGQ